MKNKLKSMRKSIVIIALLALIVFSMSACDDLLDLDNQLEHETSGIMYSWKGELPAAPTNPEINWIYYNTGEKTAYIYDGTAWQILVKDGVDGNTANITAVINGSGELVINGIIIGKVTGTAGTKIEIKDGTWWIDNADTGIPITGADGKDSIITIIGGTWHIDGIDTEISVYGPPGTPGSVVTIQNGYWYIDGVTTGVPVQGPQGDQGIPGTPGATPWICIDGFWHIGGTPNACNTNCTGIRVTGNPGEKGETGEQGEPGDTPWICIDGFWHIGGTPNACNANCTGIAAAGTTAGQNQLFITQPIKKTYVTCVSDPFNTTGLIVSFQIQSFIIPINPINYILFWNNEVINSGNTDITAETGIKTIYVIDITGRIGEFTITVTAEHNGEWRFVGGPYCLVEVQERRCYSCGDYQTQEVEPRGHRYNNNWLTKTPATCIAKEVQGRTCSYCGDHQTQEFGEPLGYIGNLNWVITPWAEIEMCERSGCTGHDIIPVFAIGDTGPAGGIIFYVADGQEGRQLGFTVQGYGTPGDEGYFASYTAYYLEAAPENISGSHIWASDPWDIIPGLSTNGMSSADEEPDRAIGRGRMNTAIIIARGIEMGYTTPAASECAAIETGGTNDWFLPSKHELNAMYIAKAHNVASLPASGYFWSSSQGRSSMSFVLEVNFDDGSSGGVHKDYDIYIDAAVRAIRAF